MANVLNEEKKQQVIALDGWAGRCARSSRLRASVVKPPARLPEGGRDWGASVRRLGAAGGKTANEVITDFGAEKPAIAVLTDPNGNPNRNPKNLSTKGKARATSKPANEVITDS